MKKFETGKRYTEQGVTFEIVKRTAKFITYVTIHHPGKFNECRTEEKRTKIHSNGNGEVFFTGHCEVEA